MCDATIADYRQNVTFVLTLPFLTAKNLSLANMASIPVGILR
jgi:hypothetical protein